MADDPADELVAAARLDDRAAGIVRGLPRDAAAQLLTAWRAAVARQDREVDAAIEGSLSLVPGLLRRRVLKVLTRGRA